MNRISSVTKLIGTVQRFRCVSYFLCFSGVRRLILLCCSSLTVTASDIKTVFFRTVSHIQLSTVFKFILRITLIVIHVYIRYFVYALSYITVVVGYIRVGPYARVYSTSHLYPRFPCTRFPSWRCLHAVSITRRFRTG